MGVTKQLKTQYDDLNRCKGCYEVRNEISKLVISEVRLSSDTECVQDVITLDLHPVCKK